MGPETIFDKIREWIGGLAWDVFLWSCQMTQEQYLDAIYQQEVEHRKTAAPRDTSVVIGKPL